MDFRSIFIANKKIEQIRNIEETKLLCRDNTYLTNYLNKIEDEVMNRQNVFQHFIALFNDDKLNLDTNNTIKVKKTENDNKFKHWIINLFPEVPQRSQLWHTLTSALLWVFLLVLMVIFLIGILFQRQIKDKKDTLLGILIGIVVLAGLIWIFQYLFGLIPVILNRAYINYAIQFIIVQVLPFWGLHKLMKRNQNKIKSA